MSVGCLSGVSSGGSTYRPTVIVTVDFGCLDAAGRRLCEDDAVFLEDVRIGEVDDHPNPAFLSVARAVETSKPSTSGTGTCAGPLETVSAIVVPDAVAGLRGVWRMTVFSGRSGSRRPASRR